MSKVLVPFVLIFAGLGGLIYMGVAQGGIPELQVQQLVAGEYADREVKVHGFLERIESDQRPLRFSVRDKEDPSVVIDVYADRTRPDTFQEEYDVAVQGRWDPTERRFVAEQIFTKCPSKYEAEAKEGLGGPQQLPQGAPEPAPTASETPDSGK